MTNQLGKVLEAARHGKATVQVIPFKTGAHAAADGYFVLLEFDDTNLSPVVFLESLIGIHFLERKAEIVRYREAVEYQRDSVPSSQDSLTLVEEYRGIYVSN